MRFTRFTRTGLVAAALVAASLGAASPAHATVTPNLSCPTVTAGSLDPSPAHDGSTDWHNCDFTLAHLGATYDDTDFSNVNLAGATFDGQGAHAGLMSFDFTGAGLQGTTFDCISNMASDQNSNMYNVTFTGANATGAIFNGCGMETIIVSGVGYATPANFTNAQFNAAYDSSFTSQWGGHIADTDLAHAVFTGATFKGIEIRRNWLDAATFAGATFQPSDVDPEAGQVDGAFNGNYLSDAFNPASDSGVNLSGATFTDVTVWLNDFRKANLTHLTLADSMIMDPYSDSNGFLDNDITGAQVDNLHLNSAQVREDFASTGQSTIDGLHITNSNIMYSDFSGISYTNSDFTGDVFTAWGQSGGNAPKGYFWGGADFHGTTFTAGKFDNISNVSDIISGVDVSFADASLAGASFANSQLLNDGFSGANFDGANLSGASFDNAVIDGVSFKPTGAGITAVPVNMHNATFGGATLSGGIDMHSANLSGANLDGSHLGHGNLNLAGANLDSAHFTNLDLAQAWLWWDPIGGINISGASVAGTDFSGQQLFGLASGGITGTPVLPDGYILTKEGTGVGTSSNADEQGYIIGAGVDLMGAKLAGMDLTGVDLSGTRLSNVDFTNATLTGTSLNGPWWPSDGMNLTNADLTSAHLNNFDFSNYMHVTLDNAKFVNADLVGAAFQDVSATGIDFSGADVSKAMFDGANLTGVKLVGASLDWTSISGTTLNTADANLVGLESSHVQGLPKQIGTDANKANWSVNRKVIVGPGVVASYSSLYGQDFHGRNLTGLRARYSDLSGDNFASANLTNAKLDFADLEGATMTGATLTGVTAVGANAPGVTFGAAAAAPAFAAQYGGSVRMATPMAGANLRGANLKGATFTDLDLTGTDFSGANLKDTAFSGSSMNNADLTGANLSGARFTGTNLSGADLTGATLTGADLKGANLTGADLHGADLSGVDLTGVDLRGVDTSGVTWGEAKCNDGIAASAHPGKVCPVAAPPGTRSQTKLSLPKSVKRGASFTVAAKTRQGVSVTVSVAGKCTVAKVYGKVRGKKVVTGYKVKAKGVKGTCTVSVISSPSASYATLLQTKNVAVK